MLKRTMKYGLGVPVVLLLTAALLSGCGDVMVLNPKGPIGQGQKDLIILTSILCAVVLVPVLAMTAFIVYRYRDRPDNKAPYRPNWSHSTILETIWWVVPVLIIAVLAVVTVRATYALEPSKPIASEKKELVVQVTSLDWKWLFTYPEQGVAAVNELYIPEDVPIRFELTSDAPMNSFWIPQLGGQVYAMSGMAMTLYLQADEAGTYYGSSANFSGEHFAHMTFDAVAVPRQQFDEWVEQVKKTSPALTQEGYDALAVPGTTEVQYFSAFPEGLFERIVTKYTPQGEGAHAGPSASHNGH
jgi:cytochrome o ubiquinol oxidase subunit 2